MINDDIQFLEAERMTDESDGGGRMTAVQIPDNVPGNLFPKISRIDAVYGRVNLRKIYVAVKTATLEVYAGSHIILSDPPDNERVHSLIFSTGSHFDERSNAQDRVESYVIEGPLSRYRLYGNQLEGQRTVRMYTLLESPLPEVGEVLVLSVEPGSDQQFVRITDVAHEERTFIDVRGSFVRRVITISLSDKLRQNFDGAEPIRYTYDPAPTKIRESEVADASTYYGVQRLTQAATNGDLTIKLDSVYTPIVPTTQAETPIVLAPIPGASFLEYSGLFKFGWLDNSLDPYVTRNGSTFVNLFRSHDSAADGPYTNFFEHYRYNRNTELGLPILPEGSRIANLNGDFGWFTGDASGRFEQGNGTHMGDLTDEFVFDPVNTSQSYWLAYGNGYHHEFKIGTYIGQPSHTKEIEITLGTRGTIYAETLLPIPKPATLVIAYRALGRWYELRDDLGNGELHGDDPAYGVGTIDYVTGGCTVTLGALPDVGSSVLFNWSTAIHYQQSTVGAVPNVSVNGTLGEAATPGTVVFSWLQATVTKTASADAQGIVTGDATGTVMHATGEYYLEFPNVYDQNTQLQVDYDQDVISTQILTGLTASGSNVTFNLGVAIKPGSLTCEWQTRAKYARSTTSPRVGWNWDTMSTYYIGKSSSGSMKLIDYDNTVTDNGIGDIGFNATGTVNYSTGEVLLPVLTKYPYRQYDYKGFEWETVPDSHATTDFSFITGQVVVSYIESSATPVTKQVFIDLPSPKLRFGSDLIEDSIIPGSLLFAWNGAYYMDRNGSIYKDVDIYNGSGILAGTVDYATREVTLDVYQPHVSGGGITVYSLLTEYGAWTATDVQFRTAGSPLRPASFYIQATTHDGELITGTCDQNGNITGDRVEGIVQQDMGVVSARFGEYVLDSSLSADDKGELWYDPADVVGGVIWRPSPVLPATIKYNCVVLTNLPLDAEVLGLDPTRLPSDGRVPSVRPANVLVIHDTGDTELFNPVSPATTYSSGRTNVQGLWLQDDTGTRIPDDQFTFNLALGEITTAAVLDLGAFTQPLHLMARVEDIVLASDVQIDGTVSISAPLLHDYPVDTYVSAAMLTGDLQARVTNVFDQATWTGVWSDTLIGSQANAEYDTLNYPWEVLNDNSIKERFRFNFTSTTSFQCYGENLGLVGTGSTAADFAPVNPVTGDPYFVVRAAGWGGGWSAGNQLRGNIIAASAPAWVTRTILSGAELTEDAIRLERRGDID